MILRNILSKGTTGQQIWRGLMTSGSNTAKKQLSPLAELRKKTGYGLSLCKKALASCNDDVTQAQKWLDERAQAEGWNKANKLEGRTTSHGLIGVQVDGKQGVILELNCETDFVAKNNKFLTLLHEVMSLNLQAVSDSKAKEGSDLSVHKLDRKAIDQIDAKDGKTMADLIALKIGLIGENIAPNTAEHFVVSNPNLHLIGYTHPPGGIQQGPLFYGRYGVLMAIEKTTSADFNGDIEIIGRQLCQHVVGMNPTSVGDLNNPKSWPAMKEDESVKDEEAQVSEADFMGSTHTEMIHQPFLLDTDRLVRDILIEVGLNVKAFVRYEVGQNRS